MARLAGMQYIGDPAEGRFITMEWHPDPDVLSAEILKMADDFDNWEIAMEEATDVLIEDTKMHFRYEEGPDEVKWQELSRAYELRKMAGGHGSSGTILMLTGDLYGAATSRKAWFHTERDIMFNAEALPKNPKDGVNYGMAHQDGTGAKSAMKEEAFRILEPMEARKDPRLTQAQIEFVQGFSRRGLDLPARPFIGASEIAIGEVEAVFLRHLHNTVEVPWEEEGRFDIGGIGEHMGSNVLGTFPVMGRTGGGQPILRTPRGPRFGRK